MSEDKSQRKFTEIINLRLFLPVAIPLVIFIVLGAIYKDGLTQAMQVVLGFTLTNFGWFYTLGTVAMLLVCLWLVFSRHGNLKLGGADAKPEISTFTWWSIALTTGIGIGICFFGVAEPMMHYMSPPPFDGDEPKSMAAAAHSIKYSYFHWALQPYAIYTCAGLPIALAFYNSRQPFRVSSSLYGLFGDRIKGGLGTISDSLPMFTMAAASFTTLGFGTLQISSGLSYLSGITVGQNMWLVIIAILAAIYTISSYTGLHKGIKTISLGNVWLYFVLMAFVLVVGPTLFIINNTVTSVGDSLLSG